MAAADSNGTGRPAVSVVVPTYNRADLLQRSIPSILTQSYQDFEILVVDDASADDTAERIAAFGDPRIRYLRHQTNRGGSAARNTGIVNARGRYVGFLDSDDEWLPEKLARQLAVFQAHPELDFVYAGWEWVAERTGRLEKRRVPRADGRIEGMPRWAFNNIPDLLVRREVMQSNLLDETIRSYEPYDLILRLVSKHYRAGFVPEVLVRCYRHAGARNSSTPERVKFLASLVETHEDFLKTDRRGWAHLNFTVGSVYLRRFGDSRAARPYLWRALAARPLRWKGWAYALAASLPLALYPRVIQRRVLKHAQLAGELRPARGSAGSKTLSG